MLTSEAIIWKPFDTKAAWLPSNSVLLNCNWLLVALIVTSYAELADTLRLLAQITDETDVMAELPTPRLCVRLESTIVMF